jgi:hypothetical protein
MMRTASERAFLSPATRVATSGGFLDANAKHREDSLPRSRVIASRQPLAVSIAGGDRRRDEGGCPIKDSLMKKEV